MTIFSVVFWRNALEAALLAGAAAFGASLAATSGTLNAHNFETAGIAAGMGALYAFIKQLGAVQSATRGGPAAVAAPPPHVMPNA